MRIALYQPEIAGNTGAVLRLAACFSTPVDIIEPTGFVFSDARMKRAAMDYAGKVVFTRHVDWEAFRTKETGRLMLMTTQGETPLAEAGFGPGDIILLGSESAGVPAHIAGQCARRIRIPIAAQTRSLNLSVACGIAVHEALRQTNGLPS